MSMRKIVKQAIEDELFIQQEFNPTRSGVAERAMKKGIDPESFEREYQYFIETGFISEMAGTEFIKVGEGTVADKIYSF